MRGIDLLASGCAPENPDPSPAQPQMVNFNDEQLSKIADLVIQRLQQPAAPDPDPEPAAETPEPAPAMQEESGGEMNES